MAVGRINKTTVDAAELQGRDYFIWDDLIKGFGLKVTKHGRKSYVCQYRAGGGRTGRSRRLTIGTHGVWTSDQARTEAKRILGRAAIGEDPAEEKQARRKQITVAELCDRYLAEGCATKKASTLATDKGRIKRHIKPLLGSRRVPDVNRADIRRFLQDVANGKTSADIKTGKYGRAIVKGGKGTASRTVGLLGGIFSYAIDLDLIAVNPVLGVKRFADKKSNRFLSQTELVELGEAMRKALESGVNPFGIAILRLLIFTGCRKDEIESLRWHEVDFEAGFLRLDDSKTGQKFVPLNAGALETLAAQPKLDGSEFVFPATRGEGYFQGASKIWKKLRNVAGLQDVRIHDLRHSFASIAVSSGASLPIIGALLGHRDSATTQRYAHLSDDPVRAASQAVDRRLQVALMSNRS